jgi:hypothetical protein
MTLPVPSHMPFSGSKCHGCNGFIEDHLMARLYREAPLHAALSRLRAGAD